MRSPFQLRIFITYTLYESMIDKDSLLNDKEFLKSFKDGLENVIVSLYAKGIVIFPKNRYAYKCSFL